jgi:hypothetical protein
VEFYPAERPNGPISAPVLVLIGDGWPENSSRRPCS